MNRTMKDLTLTIPVMPAEFACPNRACAASRWLVSCRPGVRELWLVAETLDARPWLIAASVPICPLCATDLVSLPSC